MRKIDFSKRKYLIKCRNCPTGFFSKGANAACCPICTEIETIRKNFEIKLKRKEARLRKKQFIQELPLVFPAYFYQRKRLNGNHPYIYLVD